MPQQSSDEQSLLREIIALEQKVSQLRNVASPQDRRRKAFYALLASRLRKRLSEVGGRGPGG